MDEREAKRIKTYDRQSMSLNMYKLGTLHAAPNIYQDQCICYDLSEVEREYHDNVLIWKEVKEELDKRGISITYEDYHHGMIIESVLLKSYQVDDNDDIEDRSKPFKKLHHGDIVDFSDYRACYTYIAFKKDITKDDDEFLLLRTCGEYGYWIPFHFSDAPEGFFQFGQSNLDCALCDPRHLFPETFLEAKCKTIPKEKFEKCPDCLVDHDNRGGINEMNVFAISQWYGSKGKELPEQYLWEHKLFLEYYEARMMPVWKEAKKKTERLLVIILKDLKLPFDVLGVIAWFVVYAPVSVC